MRIARGLLGETAVLLAAGLAFALLANWFSPRGLTLQRNYFPEPSSSTNMFVARASSAGTRSPPQAPTPAERLASKGLSVIGTAEAEHLLQDPQTAQEQIIFLDARDDEHFRQGHIPGAFQFDRYYPEKYLPTVLPACFAASKIVVYCNGGQCEDSEFAALMLVDAGIPAQKISVYLGGIADWIAQKQAVEQGERKSGTLKISPP